MPETINIVIVGASYAGSHSAIELVEKLNSFAGLNINDTPENNYHITIIEPKTAFEAITGTFNLLSEPDDFWQLNSILNLSNSSSPLSNTNTTNSTNSTPHISVSSPPSNIDVDKVYQTVLDDIKQKKFHENFVPYDDSTLCNHPNITFFHGVARRVFSNHIEVTVPLYLFSHLPETMQAMLRNDRLFDQLFENRKEVPIVVPRCNLAAASGGTGDSESDGDERDDDIEDMPRTESSLASLALQTLQRPGSGRHGHNSRASVVSAPTTLEYNIPIIVSGNDGTHFISISFPFHVLLNCSGSTSNQPIKSFEQGAHTALYNSAKDSYEHFSDLIYDLIELFYNYNLDILLKIPDTWHLTLQSLLYLPKDATGALILHYFPQYGQDVLQNVLPEPCLHTLRVLSLLAYILRLPIQTLLNYMVVPLKLCPSQQPSDELLQYQQKDDNTNQENSSAPISIPSTPTFVTNTSANIGSISTPPPPPPPPPPIKDKDSPTLKIPYSPSTSQHLPNSYIATDPELNPIHRPSTSIADQRPSLQPLSSLNQQRFSNQTTFPSSLSTDPQTPHYISIKSISKSILPIGYHLQPLPICALLTFPLLSDLYHQSVPIPKHDSMLYRFIELAAVRYMLIYSHYTRTDHSVYYNPTLPIIHRINFIGSGPTSIELLGSYMDVYYNHYQTSKKVIKSFQHDLKKKKETTIFNSENDFSRFNLDNLSCPEFHTFCASSFASSLAVSVQKRAKKHFSKGPYDKTVRSYTIHEDKMWGVHTTLAREQNTLLSRIEQLRDLDERESLKSKKSSDSHTSQRLSTGQVHRWDPRLYNRWSMITIFAFGITPCELITQYKPTPQLIMKESLDKVLTFIQRTNTPNAPSESTSMTVQGKLGHHGSPRDTSGRSAEMSSGSQNDRKHGHLSRGHSRNQSTFRQPPSMVESLLNMTKQHEQLSNILTKIPGLIFVLGDACNNPGILPMAYSAVSNAPFAAENAVLYINRVLRPFLESIAAPFSNRLTIPGSNQPNPSTNIITPFHLDSTIQSMRTASTTPDMMILYMGQFDAVITSSQSQITRFLPFGNTIALEMKKSNRGDALDKIRQNKQDKAAKAAK